MDQDINFQHTTAFAAGATTTYFIVPYRSTVRAISAIVQADPGDAETITVTNEATVGGTSVDIGVAAFGSTIDAGATATWVADSTTGDTVIAEGSLLKFVTSAASAANCDINIELDPYAR